MTIRLKLTVGSIVAILVANSLLLLVNVQYLAKVWRHEVETRVRLDLNAARTVYKAHGESIGAFLKAAALGQSLAEATQRGDRAQIERLASRLFAAGRMDMICLLDRHGKVLCRARAPGNSGDDLASDPLVTQILAGREQEIGSLSLSQARLLREGEDLARRARLALVPTPSARPTDDKERTEGLVIAAAVPIRSAQGELVGILWGGDLLNQRHQIVDAIQEDIFPEQLHGNDSYGTVTIFQGDLRIATNIALEDRTRAVGTRMSSEVYDQVIERGEAWTGPAFVVNASYIAAYEPIRDIHGNIVGALYVGLLEAPFTQRQNVIFTVVLLASLAATAACLLLVIAMVIYVLRPIGQIRAMAQRVIGGDLTARVGARPPGEMGVLCDAIEAQLKQATQQQIGRSEKLASIGRLAAGIAHEINNPLTGVLTFAHLLREKSNMDDQDRQDLDLIIHETTRAAEIVRNLLDFARERAAIKEPLNVNDVIERTIRLIRNQKLFDRIVIEERFSNALPDVDGNMNQLQQVFLNLSLNACEAMPQGGTLTIATLPRDGQVVINVVDTGCGIKPDVLDKIFEPFFTTKPVGKGTGLGLAVSYGIVEQHGGTLEVETAEGRGTTFTITLPAASGRVL
jgi:two-component system NtrC family sensor kinase